MMLDVIALNRHNSRDQMMQIEVSSEMKKSTTLFQFILNRLNGLKDGQLLQLIDTRLPAPLIVLLNRQGVTVYAETDTNGLVNTFVFRDPVLANKVVSATRPIRSHWDEIYAGFADNLAFKDLRRSDNVEPMILSELSTLPEGKALFIYHHKLPVFLLHELVRQGFDYRINEIASGEVHLLVFRP